MANTPAPVLEVKSPPRSRAPNPVLRRSAPAKQLTSPSYIGETQSVESGTQSATHSKTLPTMSKAPQLETQLARAPVRSAPAELVLQSPSPGENPAFGVPAAAICHSALPSSRLPELAAACCAWNQVIYEDGVTPGTLKAKILSLQSFPLSPQG